MKTFYASTLRQTFNRSLVLLTLLTAFLCSVGINDAEASHFRYGQITWTADPAVPGKIDFTVNHSWRYNFFGNCGGSPCLGQTITVESWAFGDGSFGTLDGTVVSVDIPNDIMNMTSSFSHTYTTSGNFSSGFSSCCRVGTLEFGANGDYDAFTIVNIDLSDWANNNEPPNSSLPPIVNIPSGTADGVFSIPGFDPNGDPITYRLIMPGETGINSLNGLSVTSAGVATFSPTPWGGTFSNGDTYAAAIVLEDGQSKTIIDFIIAIVGSSIPPTFDYTVTPVNGAILNSQPNQLISFSIKAEDSDPGDLVQLSVSGLPVGPTLAPSLPNTFADPSMTTFSWTPTFLDEGSYVLSFAAIDNNGAQTLTTVILSITSEPIWDVPPSLGDGSILTVAPGPFSQVYQAGDLDLALDEVSMMGAVTPSGINGTLPMTTPTPPATPGGGFPVKASLPAGFSWSPALPTATANPTSSTLSGTIAASDWGIYHVDMRATDLVSQTTDLSNFFIVNQDPFFTSSVPTMQVATVGSLYSITITADDPDIAISADDIAFASPLFPGDVGYPRNYVVVPAWLTHTDNGDGTLTLSGTPTVADLTSGTPLTGSTSTRTPGGPVHAVQIELHDRTTHFQHTHTSWQFQNFSITVVSDIDCAPATPNGVIATNTCVNAGSEVTITDVEPNITDWTIAYTVDAFSSTATGVSSNGSGTIIFTTDALPTAGTGQTLTITSITSAGGPPCADPQTMATATLDVRALPNTPSVSGSQPASGSTITVCPGVPVQDRRVTLDIPPSDQFVFWEQVSAPNAAALNTNFSISNPGGTCNSCRRRITLTSNTLGTYVVRGYLEHKDDSDPLTPECRSAGFVEYTFERIADAEGPIFAFDPPVVNDTLCLDNTPNLCSANLPPPVPTITDDCDDGPFTYTLADVTSGTAIPLSNTGNITLSVGINLLEYTATDNNSNTTRDTIYVAIKDIEAPDFTPTGAVSTTCHQDFILCEGDGTLTYNVPKPEDNCIISTYEVVFSNGSPAPAGLPTGGGVSVPSTISEPVTYTFQTGHTVVQYIVADASGNIDTCEFNVFVEVEPVMTIDVTAGANAMATLSGSDTHTDTICHGSELDISVASASTAFSGNDNIMYHVLVSNNGVTSGDISVTDASTLDAIISSAGDYAVDAQLDNTTSDDKVVTFTITAFIDKNDNDTYDSGTDCDGNTITISITVQPEPMLTVSANAETLCSGDTVLTTATVTAPAANGMFIVSASDPDGAGATTASTYKATGDDLDDAVLTNMSMGSYVVTYTVTPVTSGPDGMFDTADDCVGTAVETVVVTVEPKPNAMVPADFTICHNTTADFNVTTNLTIPTKFNWIAKYNGVTGGSGAASNQNFPAAISDGSLLNATTDAIDVVYNIIPYTYGANMLDNGGTGDDCVGDTVKLTVTVDPNPMLTVNDVDGTTGALVETVCSGDMVVTTATVTAPSTSGQYTVTAGANSVGATTGPTYRMSGATLDAATLTNNTNASLTVTYTVTPVSPGPNGTYGDGDDCIATANAFMVVVTVEPGPTMLDPTDQIICHDASTNIDINTNLTGNVSYKWTAAYGAVTGGSGSAAMLGFGTNLVDGDLQNTTTTSIDVVYTVTPYTWGANGVDDGCTGDDCTGTSQMVTVTVEPQIPTYMNIDAGEVCSGSGFNVMLPAAGITPSTGRQVEFEITDIQLTGTACAVSTVIGKNNINASSGGSHINREYVSGGNFIWNFSNPELTPITVTFTLEPQIEDNSNDINSSSGVDNNDNNEFCTGTAITVTVIVNPKPQVTLDCSSNGYTYAPETFVSNGVTYTYTTTLNDHYYYRVNLSDFADFDDMVNASAVFGGYPIVINDATENGLNWPFSGLTDKDNEGNFIWAAGEGSCYDSWASGEPNNSGNEDYVERSGGTWNDNNNQSQFWIEIPCNIHTYQALCGAADGSALTVAPITFAALPATSTFSLVSTQVVDAIDGNGYPTATSVDKSSDLTTTMMLSGADFGGTLLNTGQDPVYAIFTFGLVNEGCAGNVFRVIFYVDPSAVAVAVDDDMNGNILTETVCDGNMASTTIDVTTTNGFDYLITNIVVDNGTGGVVMGQQSGPDGTVANYITRADMSVLEPGTLTNTGTTNSTITYTVNSYTYGPNGMDEDGDGDDCLGTPFDVVITVEPTPAAVAVDVDGNSNTLTETVCDGGNALTTVDVTAVNGYDYIVQNIVVDVIAGANVMGNSTGPDGSVANYASHLDNSVIEPNALTNDGTVPGTVTYTMAPYTYGPNGTDNGGQMDDCVGASITVVITVEPDPTANAEDQDNGDGDNMLLTSAEIETICHGTAPLTTVNVTAIDGRPYLITKIDVDNGTGAVISGNQTDPNNVAANYIVRPDGSVIEPNTLDNSGTTTGTVTYTMRAYTYGPDGMDDMGADDDCLGDPITVVITVEPNPTGTLVDDDMNSDIATETICTGEIPVTTYDMTALNGGRYLISNVSASGGQVSGQSSAGVTRADNAVVEPNAITNGHGNARTVTYTIVPYTFGSNGMDDDGTGDDCLGTSSTYTLTIEPTPTLQALLQISGNDPQSQNEGQSPPGNNEACSDEDYNIYVRGRFTASVPADMRYQRSISIDASSTGSLTVDPTSTTDNLAITFQGGNPNNPNNYTIDLSNTVHNNVSSGFVQLEYTYTPYIENGGNMTMDVGSDCIGTPLTFYVTIHPEPLAIAGTDPMNPIVLRVCSGEPFSFDPASNISNISTNTVWERNWINQSLALIVNLDGEPGDDPGGIFGGPPNDNILTGLFDQMGGVGSIVNNVATTQTLKYSFDPVESDDEGCEGAPFYVDIIVSPEVKGQILAGGDTVLCYDEDRIIQGVGTQGTGVFTYAWSIVNTGTNGSLSSTTAQSPTLSPGNMAGMIELKLVITDENGCHSDTLRQKFTVVDPPVITPPATAPEVCAGDTVDIMISVAGGKPGYTYAWTATTGSFVAGTEDDEDTKFDATGLSAGTYTVTVIVTDQNDCSDTEDIQLIVNGIPTITLISTPIPDVCEGSTFDFNIEIGGGGTGLTYTWEPAASFMDATVQDPTFIGLGANVGVSDVTVTVSDDDMCSAMASFTMTVLDTPSASPAVSFACGSSQADFGSVPSGGDGTYTYAWTGPGSFTSTDSSFSIMSPTTADNGIYTVVVTDGNGCVGSGSVAFDVGNSAAPTIAGCTGGMTADIDLTTDAGVCTRSIDVNVPVVTDDCNNLVTYEIQFANGSPAPASLPSTVDVLAKAGGGTETIVFSKGVTVVTYYAEDGDGNMTTCTFNVTITDEEDPVFSSCPTGVTQGADASACGALVSGTFAVSDNCDNSLTIVGTNVTIVGSSWFGNFGIGTTSVTIKATDDDGNEETCMFDVTVVDDVVPVITSPCPIDTIMDNDMDECNAVYTWSNPTFFDQCGVVSVHLTYTDGSPSPISRPMDDNNVPTTVQSITETFEKGVTIVTYTATDANGQQQTCSFTVTVEDTQDPTFASMADVTINTDDAASVQCPAVATSTFDAGPFPYTSIDFGDQFEIGGVFYTAPGVGLTGDNCPERELEVKSIVYTNGNGPVGCEDRVITITWSVVDCGGNKIDMVQVYTVHDDTNPTASNPADINVECVSDIPIPDVLVVIDEADNCDASPAVTHIGDVGTAPSCDGDIFTLVRTYRVTDCQGNFIEVVQNINVDDVTDPTADVPADISVECFSDIPAADISVVMNVMDNCDGAPTVAYEMDDVTMVACDGDIQTVLRTYSVTDCSGNSINVVQTIYVDDVSDPTADVPADISVECFSDIPAFDISVVMNVMDNCDGAPTVAHEMDDVTMVTCDGDVQTVLRTYSVTDCSGNSINVVQTIYVDDVTDPTADVPADISVECFSDIPAADISVVMNVMDNCDGAPTVAHEMDDVTMVACDGDVQTVLRTYSVTDCSGNSVDVVQTIYVDDVSDPTADVPTDISVECFSDIPASDISVVMNVMDNCDGSPVVAFEMDDITTASCDGDIVTVLRTYSITDCSGNSANVVQTIYVDDVTDPTADVPADISVECFSDIPASDISVVMNVMDNCDGTPVVAFEMDDITTANCDGDVVIVLRTYSVTDCSGNSADVVQTIYVDDVTDPTADVPADISVECFSDIPASDISVVMNVMDNCDGAPTVAHEMDDVTMVACDGDVQTVLRTYSVTDCSGNSINVVQTIYVDDVSDPTADVPADISVECFSDIPASDISVVMNVMDNCDGAPTVAHEMDDVTMVACDGDVQTVLRTYSVTDCSGNSINVVQTIYVDDVSDPTADVPADISVECFSDIPASDISVVMNVMDNCDGAPTVAHEMDDVTMVACDGDVQTVLRTYSVTDCSGNSINVVQTIYVDDVTDPTADVPADISVECFSDIPASDISVVMNVMDNCDGAPTVVHEMDDVTMVACDGDVQTVLRTYSVTDCSGNSINVVQTIYVDDVTDPTADVPADISVDCFSDIPASDISVVMNVMDNCDGSPVVAFVMDDITTASCDGADAVVMRTYSVTDCSGNSTNVVQTIYVDDDTNPTASNPMDVMVQCFSDIPAPDPAVVTDEMDNCTASDVTVTFVSDDITAAVCNGDMVTVTRTYSVTDCAANTINVMQLIHVKDTIAPTGTPPDTAYYMCFADVPVADASVITDEVDNCDPMPMVTVVDTDNGGAGCVSNPLVITRTFTITDCSGLSTDTVQTIIIADDLAPDFTGNLPADTIRKPTTNTDCQLFLDGNDLTLPTVMDNCDLNPVVTIAANNINVSFSGTGPWSATFPVGTTTVTQTVTDDCGNSRDYEFVVIIEDLTIPLITPMTCPAWAVGVDAVDADAGECSGTHTWDNPAFNDNCGLETLELVYTADPANVPNGALPANKTYTGGGALGGQSETEVFPVGTTIVTFVSTDINGNVNDMCFMKVEVLDIPPIAVCKDITVFLNESGVVTINSLAIDDGSSDNCMIDSISLSQYEFDCSDLGAPVVVTMTVTDTSGLTDMCTANVTVIDAINPIAICQNLTVMLDASGNASITPDQIDNGSNDNCTIPANLILSLDQTTFNCFDVATSATSIPNPITELFISEYIEGGSNNKCIEIYNGTGADVDLSTYSLKRYANGSTSPATITLSGTLVDGDVYVVCNSSSAGQFLAEADQTSGNINHNGDDGYELLNGTTIIDIFGEIGVDPGSQWIVNPNRTQNRTLVRNSNVFGGNTVNGAGFPTLGTEWTEYPQDFADSLGSHTVVLPTPTASGVMVTLTVEDESGNLSTCTAEVFVLDNMAPTATCQNIDVYLDANGDASIMAMDLDGGSMDNCSIDSFHADVTAFTCAEVGTNNVTLTVFDPSGNSDNCSAVVTVIDTISPVAICQDVTVTLDAAGIATLTAGEVDNGSTDNCAVATTAIDMTMFDCSMTGANTVTLTVTDVNGNSSTCTSTVTVQDTTSPIASCMDIEVYLDAAGMVSILPADVNDGSMDECGIDTMMLDITSFDCSNIAGNTVTLTVVDSNGNTSTCMSTVTVTDTIDPTATCQAIDVYLDASGAAVITAADVNDGSTDVCGIETMTIDVSSFDCSNVGANTVTLTVTDTSGNAATCMSTVTVIDTVSPTAVCMDITVDLDASGMATIMANQLDGGSSDACGIDTMMASMVDFDCSHVGPNTVTLTVVDSNGNMSTCTSTVTIADVTPAVAMCRPTTIYLDASGMATLVADSINNMPTDACGVDTIYVDQELFDCSHLGDNTITLTVEDLSGNMSTCTAIVTVVDTVSPVATCQDITAYLDAAGMISVEGMDVDGGSTDACGLDSLWTIGGDLTCNEIGLNNVQLVVRDSSGNLDTCTSMVTVVDTVPPMAVCMTTSIYLDANGDAMIMASDVDGGSTDACGIDTMYVSPHQFTCADLGVSNTTLTVVDIYGNIGTCIATVNVLDTIPPTAACKDATVTLDASGMGTLQIQNIIDFSNLADNCGTYSFDFSRSTFDCSDVGIVPVMLFVEDGSGNADTCTAMVTVEDVTPPDAVCQDVTVTLDVAGMASILASDLDGGSTDACGVDTIMASQLDFDCSDVGINSITLTVVDSNGNMNTCISMVTVVDTTMAVAMCRNTTIYLDASGIATLVADSVNDMSPDACGIDTIYVDQAMFDCSNIGDNTVTLTVEDASGNISTCMATVTVVDEVAPMASCQDITAYLDANGMYSVESTEIDGGSTDACGIDSMWVMNADKSCADVGISTSMLVVRDSSGNLDTCSANVMLLDTVPPAAVCANVNAYVDGAGMASVTAAQLNGGSSDACGIDTMYISQDQFSCADVGSIVMVTLTVVDSSGNASSCMSAVTVLDTVPPVAACKDASYTLDASGNATLSFPDIIDFGNLSDNCSSSLSFDASQKTFDCTDVGVVPVMLFVSDGNGNSDTCTAMVTIIEDTPPVALCQDDTVYLNTQGFALVDINALDAGSSDICGIDTIYADVDTFFCADAGIQAVLMTVVDSNGNQASCTSQVTVMDTIDPTAMCTAGITLYLDAMGQVITTPSAVNNGSLDNCGIDSMWLSQDTFTCTDLGAVPVTFTIMDASMNMSSCNTIVTVLDTLAPIVSCKDTTVYLDVNGMVSISADMIDDGSTDGCSTITLMASETDFTCGEIGANNVTLYVTDGSGNIDSCVAIVTVLDTLAPIMSSCPSDITLNNTPSNCSQTYIFDRPTASDACGIDTITVTAFTALGDPVFIQEFSPTKDIASFPVGVTTVTYYAVDNNMNIDSCTFVVTVVDIQAPNVTNCPADISVSADLGQCGAIVIWTEPSASDNCPGVTLTQTAGPNSGSEFPVGTTVVEYTATDAGGLMTTCTFTVTVSDDENPSVVCQDVDVYLDANGMATVDSTMLYSDLSDNCSGVTMTASNTDFDCDSVGVRMVTLIATDTSGNADTCVAMVTVIDSMAPTLTVQDVTITVGSNGLAIFDVNDAVAASGDNCEVDSIYASQDTFSCANQGSNMVDITITDVNGNSTTMTSNVVVDGMISANVVFVDLNATGNQTGLSWNDAFLNIDDVFESCLTDIDTIKVAEGIYVPSTSDRSLGYVFTGDIVVLGGYSNGGTVRDLTGTTTQMCGDIGIPTVNGDNVYHTVSIDENATNVIIDGFTINCGYADGPGTLENQGAGVLCLGKATMSNVIITDNFSVDQCAALLATGSGDLTIKEESIVKSDNVSLIGVIFGNDVGAVLTIEGTTLILD